MALLLAQRLLREQGSESLLRGLVLINPAVDVSESLWRRSEGDERAVLQRSMKKRFYLFQPI